MRHTKSDQNYIVVLEQGDRVIETLTEFCRTNEIKNAYFRGIGAVKELECGYYSLNEKEYYFTTYPDTVEVASMTGNVMQKDGQSFLHVHGVFTDTSNNAFGGHVKEMTVAVTLEIVLTPLSSNLSREHDEEIGLYLINCPGK